MAAVVVLGLLAWFLFLRPAGTATPAVSTAPPTSVEPSAEPSVLITPTDEPSESPSEQPSESASPKPSGTTSAACADALSKTQCDWAVYLKQFVVINTCAPDPSDEPREAFTCAANSRGKLDGNVTVSLRWADDNADLTDLMDDFFARAKVSKSKIGSNWKKPPALTNWWYTDKPKDILGKLGSADADDGSGRVSWTFKQAAVLHRGDVRFRQRHHDDRLVGAHLRLVDLIPTRWSSVSRPVRAGRLGGWWAGVAVRR